MRHRNHTLRLTQKPHHSALLQRNLVTSLVLYEAVRTTRNRARVIQPLIDHLITIAKKKEPQQAIRAINAVVTDVNASRKLMEVLKQRYSKRTSGFTTVKPAGARKGDGAALVDLALLDREESVVTVAAPKKKAAKKSSASSESSPSSSSSK
jgi:large subunit ribosomal protein L17